MSKDQRDFLFFSQTEQLGYDLETGLISVQSKEKTASLHENRWLTRSPLQLRPASTANALIRVYAEELYSGTYQNIIMIRKVKEVGTKPLFNAPALAYENYPTAEEPIDFVHFTHGSRIRGRNISLTFNAIDSAEGLGQILAVLKHYKIKATFFVNGEFMRRYPAAVKELAESEQEIGSLFYTWFNLADQRYKIDTDFLKQGLARNEDEYREITGRELTLLWRTPYFVINRSVLEAASALHYTLVGTDVDSLDSITRDTGNDSGLYRRGAVLVEEILARKKPGSIINLTVGKPGEHDAASLGRSDYLFQKLDVLINGLIQKGYTIVPVSRLIEAAR
jgi:peptidoglycan/xylan/chitin deacetylase (PgdA/CDA1 family)